MATTKKDVQEVDASSSSQTLNEKIKKHTAQVAVIGLGYVGLPLAVEMGKVGFGVMGVDRIYKEFLSLKWQV
jgi:heterodisulfide reductase subunit A-like polyferredoxin